MKKILFATPYFPPHIGGAQQYVYTVARGMLGYGWQVVVVTANTETATLHVEKTEGITVYRLPIFGTFSNTPIHPGWYFSIQTIIRKEKPDIINAHAPVPYMADIASLAAGSIPFVLTYHYGPLRRKGVLIKDACISLYERVFLPLLLARSRVLISTSKHVSQTIYAGHDKKTVLIPPGVDASVFVPGRYKPRNGLLFVGSLQEAERHKGLETLLQSVRLLKKTVPDISLTVLGKGDYVDGYKALCRDLGVHTRVKFAGTLRGDLLAAAYRDAAVFVHPPVYDNVPTVILEAMACKIPVVSTTVGGIPELISDGKNGLLVPPENPKRLAEAIAGILRNTRLATRIRTAGYMRAHTQYRWDIQMKKTRRVFETILV